MEKPQGDRHYDLTVGHIVTGQTPAENKRMDIWVPPQSHNETEIKRIKDKPGLLMALRQDAGVRIEVKMIEALSREEMPKAFYRMMGGTAFNAAFHEHAEGADSVMRRRLWLMVAGNHDGPITRESLMLEAFNGLTAASEHTAAKAAMLEHSRTPPSNNTTRSIGRIMGNASLILGAVPLADAIENAWDEPDRQRLVRNGAQATQEASLRLKGEVGVYPTIAQLGDPHSPLSSHIINNRSIYSGAAAGALLQAQEEVLTAQQEAA